MPSIINALAVEEAIFALEGVRVVLVTGTRARRQDIYPYQHYFARKLTGASTVASLKTRVERYIGKQILVIKGDGTIAADSDRITDIRKSYSK